MQEIPGSGAANDETRVDVMLSNYSGRRAEGLGSGAAKRAMRGAP